jgi:hypothetical protein
MLFPGPWCGMSNFMHITTQVLTYDRSHSLGADCPFRCPRDDVLLRIVPRR